MFIEVCARLGELEISIILIYLLYHVIHSYMVLKAIIHTYVHSYVTDDIYTITIFNEIMYIHR